MSMSRKRMQSIFAGLEKNCLKKNTCIFVLIFRASNYTKYALQVVLQKKVHLYPYEKKSRNARSSATRPRFS